MKYRLLDTQKEICGVVHRMLEREDGLRFYLDPAFLSALQNQQNPQLPGMLKKYGVENEEIDLILKVIREAGLLESKDEI
jgi:hypothetical protein